MRKTTKKKIAPIVITALVIFYIAPPLVFILMAMGMFHAEGGLAFILPLLCWLLAGGAVIVGVLKALLQRLDEIDGGEEEEASQY